MIRFILKRSYQGAYGPELDSLETFDIEVPELQRILLSGGMANGGPGHDVRDLVGVEILPDTTTHHDEG